ncbi:tyrosine-protein phosphatase [Deinococcus daejeonensis]|uniref:Protein-tyrosine-phosphatase n=1 Tax=Deinococcus daejeonensis TaxID=1007098 RepID=A0ABQ2IYF3_9DEIO|nr:tyrosine-protein phosphatase [Deinococcus daejeonensis]GGN31273.1 protein-tyrosine-phosphatase [Deinococcus daejeonensis]
MTTSEQPPGGLLNFRRSLPGLYRSDTLSRLTPDGRRDLKALNFSRIIDLRSRTERAADPPPFLGHPADLNLPLLPWRHRAFNEASAAARTNADHMTAMLDHAPNQIVTVLGAILDAPPGPVLIHCHAGKDRTGLIAALCSELAGQTRDQTAADYAASGPALRDFYRDQQARRTPEQWAHLAPFAATRADDIRRTLTHIDQHWGQLDAYLNAHGLPGSDLSALRDRLTRT